MASRPKRKRENTGFYADLANTNITPKKKDNHQEVVRMYC